MTSPGRSLVGMCLLLTLVLGGAGILLLSVGTGLVTAAGAVLLATGSFAAGSGSMIYLIEKAEEGP